MTVSFFYGANETDSSPISVIWKRLDQSTRSIWEVSDTMRNSRILLIFFHVFNKWGTAALQQTEICGSGTPPKSPLKSISGLKTQGCISDFGNTRVNYVKFHVVVSEVAVCSKFMKKNPRQLHIKSLLSTYADSVVRSYAVSSSAWVRFFLATVLFNTERVWLNMTQLFRPKIIYKKNNGVLSRDVLQQSHGNFSSSRLSRGVLSYATAEVRNTFLSGFPRVLK